MTGTFGAKRGLPKLTLRAINFFCHAPDAQSVSLVGDFNGWDPGVNRMRKMVDGEWFLSVDLKHGHHRYAFLIDGLIALDPRAQGVARNDQGVRVSLVPVS